MLELRRLRLLKELHERGTIAAVADALQFTPRAVSQQLALLEREAGVQAAREGRARRAPDRPRARAGRHAEALLQRAARAEADLAAAAGTVAGRGRIAAFQSVALELAIPAIGGPARAAPRLRRELIEAEPEDALPGLALGDIDLVLGDEWQHQPCGCPPASHRHELFDDPVNLALPERLRHATFRELDDEAWATGHPGMAWRR